ncbi:integrin alpha-1-like [Chelonoidis abingdonii]|uniref:integrin alpha-1-like n=1 Tax=Chelonoidis abingdonii TaxID=106734 RepID=UPI003F499EBD
MDYKVDRTAGMIVRSIMSEHFPVPQLTLQIFIPYLTSSKNPILYLTGLSSSDDSATYNYASINCTLAPSDITQVNISLRLWKPTFIKANIHSLNFTVRALLQSENSSLILRGTNQKQEIMVIISKELHPGIIPLWVILLSAFAGLLILALLIFALWKVGFFKRPLKKKMEK